MQEGDFPSPDRPAPEDEGVSHAGGHGSDPGISGDGFRSVCIGAGPEPADREDSGEKCGPGWGSDSGEASGAGYYGRKQTGRGNGAGENGAGGDPGGRSGNVYGPGHCLGRRGRQKSGPVRDVRLWRADGGRSLLLEKTEGSGGGVTPSSAAAPVWRPVRYAPAEPLEE